MTVRIDQGTACRDCHVSLTVECHHPLAVAGNLPTNRQPGPKFLARPELLAGIRLIVVRLEEASNPPAPGPHHACGGLW